MTEAFNLIRTIARSTGKLRADGIPASLINKLTGKEKKEIEPLLIDMTQSGDMTGVEALAALKTEKAIQVIKASFDKATNNSILKIKLAKLLWDATGNEDYLIVVLGKVTCRYDADKLTLMAIYLELPPQVVPDTKYLDILKHEKESAVRFQAAKGLLYNLKILSNSSDVQFGDPLYNLLKKLSDKDPKLRDIALTEVYKPVPTPAGINPFKV